MKKPWPRWLKWTVPTVCLCALLVMTVLLRAPAARDAASARSDENYVPDTPGPCCAPPDLIIDGKSFVHSSEPDEWVQTLPDGFTCAGETDNDREYYTNPAIPEQLYIYELYRNIDEVDSTGTVLRTMPVYRYRRYVDKRLHGKELICYRGEYYISMLSADYFTEQPDIDSVYYEQMRRTYGKRIEGDVPKGFILAGKAEFSGYDTVPRGELACNVGAMPIYISPDEPDVVLFPTVWQTAPAGEQQTANHKGFKVYIRYDCPFA